MRQIETCLRVLSEDEMQLLHRTSLKILSDIGIHTPNRRMLDLLRAAGCRVDGESQVVRYPVEFIEEMVGELRARKLVPDQQKIGPMTAGVSTEIFLVDYLHKTRRPGTLDDIKKGIALLERLRHFPSADAIVVPSDVPPDCSDLMTYQLLYTYQTKPGGTYILNVEAAPAIIELAQLLGRRVCYLLDTVSPLKVRKESLETAVCFAERGMPVTFCSMVTAMGSAPVTMAGAMAIQNAEYLAGIAMLRALGQQVDSFPGMVHPMDGSSLICSFGAPSIARSSVACAQMARFYGLNPSGNIALTDALMPDFQCGFEKALSLAFGACAGLHGVGGQGIVGADQGNSFEQLVIDDEWLDAYNQALCGVEVNEETLAYEVIERIGFNGSYLSDEHTLEHFRDEAWRSRLFRRQPWDIPAKRPSLLKRAHDAVEELTLGYSGREPVVSPSVKDDIDRITEEGLKRIRHGR